jgi:hypothetical protein
MSKLIEALQIFLKYGDPDRPTHCEHEVLYICNIDTASVTDEDKEKLDKLGFFYDDDEECFQSFCYGSA